MTMLSWMVFAGRCACCGNPGSVGACCNGYDLGYSDGWAGSLEWSYQKTDMIRFESSSAGGLRIMQCYFNQMNHQEDYTSMTLLVPDRDRENQEDFIWCLPVERQKFNKWYALSEKSRGIIPKEHGGIRYVTRVEGSQVRTVLVMPTEQQTDDDVMHACAFLRMVKGITARMYVIRCTDDKLSMAQTMNKVIGADPKLLEHIEDEDIEGGKEEVPQHP